MKTINDVRKAIKPLGFNVATKQYSHGQHATFFHIETKRKLKGNIFSPEDFEFWKPIFDWRKAHNAELIEIDCYGLVVRSAS